MNKKTFSIGLLLILAAGANAFAQYKDLVNDTKWHSLFGSTHKKLIVSQSRT